MKLVRILIDDSGHPHELAAYWHLVDPCNAGGPATLCTGEYFGFGESACEFDLKEVKRGGITCPQCLADLKTYKAVKL